MTRYSRYPQPRRLILSVIAAVLAMLAPSRSSAFDIPHDSIAQQPDSIPLNGPLLMPAEVVGSIIDTAGDSLTVTPVDTSVIYLSPALKDLPDPELAAQAKESPLAEFNPDPTRAVWMSALFPGLGQIYNRRYWKLPIVAGAFMGLGYGLSWNGTMLGDYTRAYNDIMDNDPDTNSYMDFFPPTVTESSLDKKWLTNMLKNNKDYCRRNRDLCVIAMIGVYLVAMVDAYVDASLSHFDISPDLAMHWAPAVIPSDRDLRPSLGLQWALVF